MGENQINVAYRGGQDRARRWQYEVRNPEGCLLDCGEAASKREAYEQARKVA